MKSRLAVFLQRCKPKSTLTRREQHPLCMIPWSDTERDDFATSQFGDAQFDDSNQRPKIMEFSRQEVAR